MTQTYDLGVY